MDPTNVFLMQPYTNDHSGKLREVIFSELEQVGCLVRRADKDPAYGSFRLQDRIDSHIKKTDVCVADLTLPRNENVLLGVGAALALQIPVITIAI